jgi:hypothetical protein
MPYEKIGLCNIYIYTQDVKVKNFSFLTSTNQYPGTCKYALYRTGFSQSMSIETKQGS